MTDRQLADDLNALVDRPKEKTLREIDPREGFPQATGTGLPVPVATGGGGISSPLTEPSYAAREFWTAVNITSTDGIFVLQLLPVKKVVMQDAGAAEVIFEYAQPT